MFTKKSISCGVSILFIGILALMSFVTVRASSSTPAESAKVHDVQFVYSGNMQELSIANSNASDGTIGRDIVLVIDTSTLMAFETTVGGNPNQSDAAVPGTHAGDDPAACNTDPGRRCEPMGKVKDAAVAFIGQLHFPYDRVAVIASTSQTPGGSRNATQVPMGVSFMDNFFDHDGNPATPEIENTEIQDAIRGLRVLPASSVPCP